MFHVTGLLLRIISLVVFSANGEKITKQGFVTMRRSKFSPKKASVSVIKAAFCSQTRFYGSHNYLQLDYIVGSKFVVHYLLSSQVFLSLGDYQPRRTRYLILTGIAC